MKNKWLDNPFFRWAGFVGDVFLLHLCWLAGCVPIVTIGASTTAAFAVAGKMAAKQDYRVFHDYAAAFQRDGKLATVTWLGLLAVGVLIAAELFLAPGVGTLGGVLLAAGAAAAVLWLCAAGCGFALLGRFAYRRARDVVKDGAKLCVASPAGALLWAAGMGGLPLLAGLAPNVFWYLFPLWLAIGGGAVVVGTAYLLRPAFARLEHGAP